MSALLGLQQPLWSSRRGMAGCATLEVEVCPLGMPWFQLDLNSPGGAVVQQTESCSCFSQLTGRMFSSQAAALGCAGVSSQPSLHAGEKGSVPASVLQGLQQPGFPLSQKFPRHLSSWGACLAFLRVRPLCCVLLETYREQQLSSGSCRHCRLQLSLPRTSTLPVFQLSKRWCSMQGDVDHILLRTARTPKSNAENISF